MNFKTRDPFGDGDDDDDYTHVFFGTWIVFVIPRGEKPLVSARPRLSTAHKHKSMASSDFPDCPIFLKVPIG